MTITKTQIETLLLHNTVLHFRNHSYTHNTFPYYAKLHDDLHNSYLNQKRVKLLCHTPNHQCITTKLTLIPI